MCGLSSIQVLFYEANQTALFKLQFQEKLHFLWGKKIFSSKHSLRLAIIIYFTVDLYNLKHCQLGVKIMNYIFTHNS